MNPHHLNAAKQLTHQGNFIIASWHRNAFAGILSHAFQNITLLVSQSFDGDIVASVGRFLGYRSVRGSSSRGGKSALSEMIASSLKGRSAAITVDGPKGPIYKVKKGIFTLSAQTSVPILPVATIATRYWVLNKSWDRMRIPKPFSKVYVLYGSPFVVNNERLDTDVLESLTEDLQTRLFELERQACQLKLSPLFTELEKDYVAHLSKVNQQVLEQSVI